MKRILSVFALIISLVCINGCGCKKTDFAFFKDKLDNIENYRYYIVSQEIYNEELLLYKKDKNVYLDDAKYRIEINTKEIASIDSEDMYSEVKEEYYQSGDDFYYKENNEWKIKQSNNTVDEIGFSISEKMFEDYKIKEKNGNKILIGELKLDMLEEFFGFEVSDAENVELTIEISNTNKVKSVSVQYVSGNGNNVIVSIKVGYTQVIKFNLPRVD